MKWIEKSFYFDNCRFLLNVIFYYVIFEIYGEAKPSNRPLRVLVFVVDLARVSMISIALGPPTTSMGKFGMVYRIIRIILQPGSEIQGIPASLTMAICLL
jgi:hypothetical protein